MALGQVQLIEDAPTTTTTGKKKGWGGIGSKIGMVAGGVVGGMAGMAAGGPAGAALGAAGGASTGANFGGMVGERLRASSEGTTSVVDRRINQQQPMQQQSASEKLKESLIAMKTMPREIQQEYAKPIFQAYVKTINSTGTA